LSDTQGPWTWPIGCKGSKNEDIEWRFSFSVGEKLLIYSFTHVQLICYALMKILLKDVIDSDDDHGPWTCFNISGGCGVEMTNVFTSSLDK
jgi:hypothetical protein